MPRFRTEEEFDAAFERDELYDEYSYYIMNNCHGDRMIGNGDQLGEAMEVFYLYEDFRDSMIVDNHYHGA